MANYSMWLLEYAYVPVQAISSVLAGQHNKGTRYLSFTYLAIRGEGHNILIDCGTNNENEYTKKLSERDSIVNWNPPEKVLANIGLKPEDIDTIIFTHAHFDHINNMDAFPNAHFYMQSKEILGWISAMNMGKKYSSLLMAINPDDIVNSVKKLAEGRLTLIDGERKNILPGIHVYPAYDGHTFASQMIEVGNDVNGNVDPWIVTGDLAYVDQNLTGINNDGAYVPVGLGVGSPLNMMKTYDEILKRANGRMERIVIGHETSNWTKYNSWTTKENLHVAELCLAPGEKSYIPKNI
jgi:glyoxylase-like metal-dependent hydrolase (beta-lactamase superfamily II)